MIYRSEEVPSNFNKIAEISDNFIVWTSENILRNDTDYEVYIQFFNPSFYLIHIDDYRISTGDSYEYTYHYDNNGMYSYVDYISSDFTKNTFLVDSEEFQENDYLRSDYLNIFIVQFIWIVIFYFIFNRLSLLFHKGGI